jgi:hypothetical protein
VFLDGCEVLGRDGRALALASPPEGSRSEEDGREVVLGISPCRPQAIVDVIGAQARSTARCEPIVEVRRGRGETSGPLREARKAGSRAQSERPTKRQSGMVKVNGSLQVRRVSNVGEDGGCDEDIDVEERRILGNKSGRAVGSRRLTDSGLGGLFTRIVDFGRDSLGDGFPHTLLVTWPMRQ